MTRRLSPLTSDTKPGGKAGAITGAGSPLAALAAFFTASASGSGTVLAAAAGGIRFGMSWDPAVPEWEECEVFVVVLAGFTAAFVAVSAAALPNPQGAAEYAILAAMEMGGATASVEEREPAAERLAAGIASQFNELLMAINGYADLLLHCMEEKEPLRRDVEQIRRAGERAAGLTGELLAYSGRQPFRPSLSQKRWVQSPPSGPPVVSLRWRFGSARSSRRG